MGVIKGHTRGLEKESLNMDIDMAALRPKSGPLQRGISAF